MAGNRPVCLIINFRCHDWIKELEDQEAWLLGCLWLWESVWMSLSGWTPSHRLGHNKWRRPREALPLEPGNLSQVISVSGSQTSDSVPVQAPASFQDFCFRLRSLSLGFEVKVLDWVRATGIPGIPACRCPIVGFLSLHVVMVEGNPKNTPWFIYHIVQSSIQSIHPLIQIVTRSGEAWPNYIKLYIIYTLNVCRIKMGRICTKCSSDYWMLLLWVDYFVLSIL